MTKPKDFCEDAGKDVCGKCDLPLKGPVSCQGLHGHSTPRPSQESMEDRFRKRFDVPVYQQEMMNEMRIGDADWNSMLNFIRSEIDHAKAEERERIRKAAYVDIYCRGKCEPLTYSSTACYKRFQRRLDGSGYCLCSCHRPIDQIDAALSLARKEDGN